MTETALRLLGRRYPVAAERAALLKASSEKIKFDDLVDLLAATMSVRVVEGARRGLQARLQWDFERPDGESQGVVDERLVFLHIMRTGGTSLSQLGSRWAAPGRARIHMYVDDLLLTPPPLLGRLRFIGGHIPVEALQLIPGRFRTVTVLRDPVARAVSHYSRLVNTEPAYKDLTLDAFISSGEHDAAVGNYQARQLAHRLEVGEAWLSYSPYQRLRTLGAVSARYPVQALFDSTPMALSDDELFQAAGASLAGIDFVGVTDDLASIASRVAGVLGARVQDVPRLNASPSEPLNMSDNSRKKLESRNTVDRELYELAASGVNRSC